MNKDKGKNGIISEIAPQANVTNTDNLQPIPGTRTLEERLTPAVCPLTSTLSRWHACLTYKVNDAGNAFFF